VIVRGRRYVDERKPLYNMYLEILLLSARGLLSLGASLQARTSTPRRHPFMITALSLVTTLTLHVGGAAPPDTLNASLVAPVPLAAPVATPGVSGQLRTNAPEWASLMAPVTLMEVRPMTLAAAGPASPGDVPQLVEYSDGYFTRLTIHQWASYLTLPLFVGQYYVGSRLIDGEDSSSLRNWHGILTGSIAGLFAVNTVTGVWNMWEARKDPEGRTRRTIHSVLMLLADAGFVATGALAHESEGGSFDSSDYNAHRGVAIASMATALVSYAIMLPFFRSDE
jgi:hypothetical protein